MLKAIRKFFGIQEKTVWVHNRNALADLPFGTRIIDNGGITEGWPCVEWTKSPAGVWSNGASIVSNDYFQMPFAVVGETKRETAKTANV